MTESNKQTISPPFVNLPSFNCGAIILSYVLLKPDAKCFLKRLSKNAGLYYEQHKEILSEFLTDILLAEVTKLPMQVSPSSGKDNF